MIRRGEIYWFRLDPAMGAEIKKTRPAVVISNNLSNQHSPLITILPITSQADRVFPFEVFIPAGEGGLDKKGKIKANQIRTVDKSRIDGGPLGSPLSEATLFQAEEALKIHLGME